MTPFTRAELLALPVTIDIKTAARALGIGAATAYRLAAAEAFPVRIFRVGASYRIPTAALLDHLGINRDDPGAQTPNPQQTITVPRQGDDHADAYSR